jgi:hypothetical protein
MHIQAIIMDLISQLEDLKGVTDRLSIEIITDNFFDSEITIQSGHCKVKGKNVIIIDKLLSIEEQIKTILHVINKFNLEMIYVPLWIREHLETNNTNKNKYDFT